MINNKGQTLIETLLYVLIVAVLFVLITSILVDMIITQNKVTTIADANDTVRIVLKEMTQNIEAGYAITSPTSSSTNSSELTIQTDSQGDTISFYSSGGVIYSKYDNSAPEQISSSNVSTYNLNFTEESNSGLSPTIFITLTETNVGATGLKTSKTYETTATQRRQ
jgi:type II secretory pathway component PulJ